ncbi:MAG: 2-phospho-L-lactate transferase CofD family protein, partial [Acidobacteriota bacterium]|nr:2-phospho-L-lactate transferase CofD family protein [Acidobacteriota bacterium]
GMGLVRRVWLEPDVDIHPAAAGAIRSFDAAVIGPGSFYTSLMPILLVKGAREAFASVDGPIVFVANLLSEGLGMEGMTAARGASLIEEAIGRPVDVIVFNTGRPPAEVLARYAAERKTPLDLGDVSEGCEVVTGNFWRGDIARHDRRRLGTAVWAALAQKLCL